MATWDTIVIGGGTMGTAAAWELGKRGRKALVLEQFDHVHDRGAHSGNTRVIRHAYAEGAAYVPLVLRADDLWQEIEAASGETVFHRVGALEIDAKLSGNDHAQRARASATEANIPFDWLSSDQIANAFPQFAVQPEWEAGWGARSGFLDVDRSLRALARAAREHGVEIRERTPVTAWGTDGAGVWVDTAGGRETAERLIVTAGAWAGRMLSEIGLPLRVLRKTLWWLEMRQPEVFTPGRFPVFIADRPGIEFYGFPIWGRPGLKCANHAGGEPVSPDAVERSLRPGEEQEAIDAARWLFGDDAVTGTVLHAAVCLYTSTPDGHFLVDRHPDLPNVVFGAGFSGHGFKFTPAIGELLVDLLENPARQPVDILALDRFAALA